MSEQRDAAPIILPMTADGGQRSNHTSETDIQNQIRVALSPYCIIFRMNVGLCYTKDGRPMRTGVPVGFSDLFGHRKSDGRAVYIEVKTPSGKVSPAQIRFLECMAANGAIAGVCRSVEDALRLVGGDPDDD